MDRRIGLPDPCPLSRCFEISLVRLWPWKQRMMEDAWRIGPGEPLASKICVAFSSQVYEKAQLLSSPCRLPGFSHRFFSFTIYSICSKPSRNQRAPMQCFSVSIDCSTVDFSHATGLLSLRLLHVCLLSSSINISQPSGPPLSTNHAHHATSRHSGLT